MIRPEFAAQLEQVKLRVIKACRLYAWLYLEEQDRLMEGITQECPRLDPAQAHPAPKAIQ